MIKRKKSPYLTDSSRLADVIAAIQAMGTYKFYKLDFTGWADRISADTNKAAHWQRVFEQHPEFFRLDSGKTKASLVSRRQNQKRYDVDAQDFITKEKFDSLSDERKRRISRGPLKAEEIAVLINAAVELHSRAVDRERLSVTLMPSLMGLLGVILGAAIGFLG